MPKSFSDKERVYIKQRLIEEVKKCLAVYGIRKTTVDELVKRVNIPKGTFYLFYESKERLIFDVILQFNDDVQRKMISEVDKIKSDINPEKLTDIIFNLYKTLDDSFIPNIISNGELDFFMKNLPQELSQLHSDKDTQSFELLLSMIPKLKVDNINAVSAAFRGVFLLILHKQEIGIDVFDDTLLIILRGIINQIFEGK